MKNGKGAGGVVLKPDIAVLHTSALVISPFKVASTNLLSAHPTWYSIILLTTCGGDVAIETGEQGIRLQQSTVLRKKKERYLIMSLRSFRILRLEKHIQN